MTRIFKALFLTAILFALPALVQPAAAQPRQQSAIAAYTLGAGDRLRVVVFGEEDLSGEFEVDGTGFISFKLVGRQQVLGYTLAQTETLLSDRLKQGGYLVDPKISIEVLNFRPFFILGEVEKRGQYPYVNGMTVANAIAIAGGYTYRAAKNRITIQRFQDPSKKEAAAGEETTVLPGDIIRVPERFF
jgi:protein involved in polysaccharide export with SLBB domain